MRHNLKWSILLAVIVLGAMSCGAGNPACDNFPCEEGFSCLIQNGDPVCVPDGGGGGGGGNQVGEACETDGDCESPLLCRPDLNGDDVCTNP